MTPGSFHSKVWLARHRVDFRKGHSGLLAECYKMGIDPYKGNLVIFIGRHRRRIKVVGILTFLWEARLGGLRIA